jgi:lipopolysaccharide transport system ATP-binding protein
MSEVGTEGRTVLFVSHNMQAIRQLCGTAIWLNEGRIMAAGPSEAIVNRYLQAIAENTLSRDLSAEIAGLPRDPTFRLKDITLLQDGRRGTEVLNGKPLQIDIAYDVYQESVGLHVYFQLLDFEGTLLFESINNGADEDVPVVLPGAYVARALIPADFLAPIQYTLRFFAGISNVRGFFPEPVSVTINVQAQGVVNRAYPGYQSPGKLLPLLSWQTVRREL